MPGATRGSWSESAGAGPSGRARPEDYRDYRCVTWHLEPTVRYVLTLFIYILCYYCSLYRQY